MHEGSRRRMIALIGNAVASPAQESLAEALGRGIIERGHRLVTGGRGGVMEAASRGARAAARYTEGLVVGILPGPRVEDANEYVDIAIPTNLGLARNVLVVASADVVLAVGGGAGTLSELALAWQLDKPIVALEAQGQSQAFAGARIDDRRRAPIGRASTAEDALAQLDALIGEA